MKNDTEVEYCLKCLRSYYVLCPTLRIMPYVTYYVLRYVLQLTLRITSYVTFYGLRYVLRYVLCCDAKNHIPSSSIEFIKF